MDVVKSKNAKKYALFMKKRAILDEKRAKLIDVPCALWL
jgi:hypothetical protein